MKIKNYIKHPLNILVSFSNIIPLKFIDDQTYLKIKYRLIFGKKLNLQNPKSFNEKLQWLKLYDRKNIYTKMVNKYEVKQYVSNLIGEEYIIPTLGIYEKGEKIDYSVLPNQFVIKPTNTSGNVFICKDKNNTNLKKIGRIIKKWNKRQYYYFQREWPYKNLRPQIIIEQYMEDSNKKDLMDYKIFCFNGKPKLILVCSNRNGINKNTDFFDINWNLLPFTRKNHCNNFKGIEKPQKLTEMIKIAEKLSKEIPFIRVDLYEINGKVFFGELTFYPSGGFEGFEPEEYDIILGEMLELHNEKVDEKNEK